MTSEAMKIKKSAIVRKRTALDTRKTKAWLETEEGRKALNAANRSADEAVDNAFRSSERLEVELAFKNKHS